MDLYSLNGAKPVIIPNRIRLPDGSTRTDRTTYTADDLNLAGWVLAPPKPSAGNYENVVWNGIDNWVITPFSNTAMEALIFDHREVIKADRQYKESLRIPFWSDEANTTLWINTTENSQHRIHNMQVDIIEGVRGANTSWKCWTGPTSNTEAVPYFIHASNTIIHQFVTLIHNYIQTCIEVERDVQQLVTTYTANGQYEDALNVDYDDRYEILVG